MNLLKNYDLTKNVYMSNDFIESNYMVRPELDLTVKQRQLIFYLISHVDKNTLSFKQEIIQISDYCELFDINYDGGRNKKLLRQSLLDLYRKAFFYKVGTHREKAASWLGDLEIDYEKGIITTRLSDKLKDYLLQLKKYYFNFQLGYIANFKSKYSYDLYLICQANKFKKKFYINCDKVKETLCGHDEKYKRFFDFNKRCLQPAIDEINNLSDIVIRVEPHKTGAKITELLFYVRKKKKSEMSGVDLWKEIVQENKGDLLKRELREQFDNEIDEEYEDRFMDETHPETEFTDDFSTDDLCVFSDEEDEERGNE